MDGIVVEFMDEREVRARALDVFGELGSALDALLPDADIQHVGSTSVPGAITKGDLDVCVLVERAAFENADRILGEHFARNVGSDQTPSLSSFVDDGRDIPVGVQLVARGGREDLFVRWRDLLRESPRVLGEYNDLKRRWHGRSHDGYREQKSSFIARELGCSDTLPAVDRVIFRRATVDDGAQLAAARWAFRIGEGEAPIESEAVFAARYVEFFRVALSSGRWTYWIAELPDGSIVAHMAVGIVQSIPRPSRVADQWGYLTDCYTQASFRHRGIGRDLLAHVAEWARNADLELLLVWPSEESEMFYARAGFARDDEVRILRLRAYDAPPATNSGSLPAQSDER